MTALEIFLLFVGFACIVVSFVMPARIEKKQNTSIEPELSEFQLATIQDKVEKAVEQEIENVVEKTEISLDKISNTKVLEMQEYANTIFNEMNRNHNETMFLYDMLNEKSKDIKNIVRDLNIIRQAIGNSETNSDGELSEQDAKANELIEQLFLQAAQEEALENAESEQTLKETAATKTKTSKSTKRTSTKKTTSKTTKVKDSEEKEVKQEEIKEEKPEKLEKAEKKTTRTRGKKAAIVDTKAQIISMHESGKSAVEIAKALNVGVGQTRLVIDLYEGQK